MTHVEKTRKTFCWDQYFMTFAYLVSMKSKDPSTRVGAVIVGTDHEVRATGYNGLPRGLHDYEHRYFQRDYKILAEVHAEENAILNCVINLTSSKGCTLYCQWHPCASCARMIIQSGIKTIVIDGNFPGNHHDTLGEHWKYNMHVSAEMLAEAGITVRKFIGNLIKIEGLYAGKSLSVYQQHVKCSECIAEEKH